MENTNFKISLGLIQLLIACCFLSCDKEEPDPIPKINETVNINFGALIDDPDSVLAVPILDTATFWFSRETQEAKFDLDMPPVRNQGNEGSCVAFAVAYAARSYNFHRDNKTSYRNTEIMSPEFLYNSARGIGTCEEAGMHLRTALDFLEKFGVSTWESMPYSDSNGCTTVPDNDQLTEALCYRIERFSRVPYYSENGFKNILKEGNTPIMFTATIDSSFIQAGADFIWSKEDRPTEALHAMVITGWDDQKSAWKVMNSWSSDWGDAGYGWIHYDYFGKVVYAENGVYVMETLGSMTDIDGNCYKTTTIKDQVWMAENLRTTNYNDGTPIPEYIPDTLVKYHPEPAYSSVDRNDANDSKYGLVYNYYAVSDSNLCPTGWHIPTLTEMIELIDNVGGYEVASGRMKSIRGWKQPNTGATNESGFTALPAGRLFFKYDQEKLGEEALFWTTSEWGSRDNAFLTLKTYTARATLGGLRKYFFISCRCIKD